jgi:hypothetical protein
MASDRIARNQDTSKFAAGLKDDAPSSGRRKYFADPASFKV